MDGWELVQKISEMDKEDVKDVFSIVEQLDDPLRAVIKKYGYIQAKERYEKWIEELYSIRVGDEIVRRDGVYLYYYVVTEINREEKVLSAINCVGGVIKREPIDNWEKTGVHYAIITEFLKNIIPSSCLRT